MIAKQKKNFKKQEVNSALKYDLSIKQENFWILIFHSFEKP